MKKKTMDNVRVGDRVVSKRGNTGEVLEIPNKLQPMYLVQPIDSWLRTPTYYERAQLRPETYFEFITRKDGFGLTPWWVAIAAHAASIFLVVRGIMYCTAKERDLATGHVLFGLAAMIMLILWVATRRNYFGKPA